MQKLFMQGIWQPQSFSSVSLEPLVWSSIPVVVIAFTESEYTTSESNTTLEVCVELVQAPDSGLECNLSVTLRLENSSKAGWFAVY